MNRSFRFPRPSLALGRALARSESGLAYIEFAISVTVLLLLFFGAVEVTRYVLIVQKMEKTVSTVTDILARIDPNNFSPTQSKDSMRMFNSASDMMSPYPFGANGRLIVSDVTRTGSADPVVNGQYCGGNGTLPVFSKVGSSGGSATLPAGFTLDPGGEVLVGEIYYDFVPMVAGNGLLSGTQIYRTAIEMPRFSQPNQPALSHYATASCGDPKNAPGSGGNSGGGSGGGTGSGSGGSSGGNNPGDTSPEVLPPPHYHPNPACDPNINDCPVPPGHGPGHIGIGIPGG